MPRELEREAGGQEAGELRPLERAGVLAGEQDRVAGGEVFADADRRAPAGEAAAGVGDDRGRAVDHAPAGGAGTRAPVHLLDVREEALVEQADAGQRLRPQPERASRHPLDVARAGEGRTVTRAGAAERHQTLPVRDPSPGEVE